MYIAFRHSHVLFAYLSFIFAVVWAIAAWNGADQQPGLQGRQKLFYILNRAFAGLAGLTGLVITFVGPWRHLVFPYVGLAAFMLHGGAATVSKRVLGSGRKVRLQATLLLQNVALWLAAYVMMIKSF
jgi:hypothetical protein